MEHSFLEVDKSNQSRIKFSVSFKSYLDASGVPTDYYTDQKLAKHYPPKVETDPLKKLLEKKDKYKIKVPDTDRNIELVNRLSQLTLLQQGRRNANRQSSSTLDLFHDKHHQGNTLGSIQMVKEENDRYWLREKTNLKLKKNFLKERKLKEGINKLNSAIPEIVPPIKYDPEAKDAITGEYVYLINRETDSIDVHSKHK